MNGANRKGNTPLHEAVKWHFLHMVALLLQHGADPMCRNAQNLTPVDLAKVHVSFLTFIFYQLAYFSYCKTRNIHEQFMFVRSYVTCAKLYLLYSNKCEGQGHVNYNCFMCVIC